MARQSSSVCTESSTLIQHEKSRTQNPPCEGASIAEPGSGPLNELFNAIVDKQITPVEFFASLPAPMVAFLNDAAYSVGQTDFSSLCREQQSGLCDALVHLAIEAPAAFDKFSRPSEDHNPDSSNSQRVETSKVRSPTLISTRQASPTFRIMCELRCSNRPSSAGDDFGRSSSAESTASFTLADMLGAAIAGKIEPAAVYQALPKNFTRVLDQAAQQSHHADFLGLSIDAQKLLFAAILKAASGTKLTP